MDGEDSQLKMGKRFSLAIASAFIILIAMPLCVMPFVSESKRISEKRAAVDFPSLANGYHDFASTFERWFEDHFGLRSAMIRFYRQSRFELGLLGTYGEVVRGKDDWLYLSGGGEGDPIQSYSGAIAFSEAELDRLQNYFKEWETWLENRGIEFLVLIAPNKVSVYPEYLPDGIPSSPYGTRTERFGERISGMRTSFVFPVDELIGAKEENSQLYYKLDTHWNSKGAFVAYLALVQALPNSIRFPVTDVRFDEKLRSGGDLSHMLGIESDWEDFEYQVNLNHGEWAVSEGDWATAEKMPYRFSVDDATLPKALVLHDSFMEPMGNMLARHFSETTFSPDSSLNIELISKVRPDWVILEFTERTLHGYLNYALPDDERRY